MMSARTGPALRRSHEKRGTIRKKKGKRARMPATRHLLQKNLLDPSPEKQPSKLLEGLEPLYETAYGAAYAGDSLELMRQLPGECLSAVITSPPYALHFKKEYGNVDKDEYVKWFLPFAFEIKRALRKDGSFVLNIGGSYNRGVPTRSLYHLKLLIALCDDVGFHLAQECFWYNPAKLPTPEELLTGQRIRVKDSQ